MWFHLEGYEFAALRIGNSAQQRARSRKATEVCDTAKSYPMSNVGFKWGDLRFALFSVNRRAAIVARLSVKQSMVVATSTTRASSGHTLCFETFNLDVIRGIRTILA